MVRSVIVDFELLQLCKSSIRATGVYDSKYSTRVMLAYLLTGGILFNIRSAHALAANGSRTFTGMILTLVPRYYRH